MLKESKTMIKMVFFSDEDDFCFCDREFSKTCKKRASKDLHCIESIIRITPIERDVDRPANLSYLDPDLRGLSKSANILADHLDRLRGLSKK